MVEMAITAEMDDLAVMARSAIVKPTAVTDLAEVIRIDEMVDTVENRTINAVIINDDNNLEMEELVREVEHQTYIDSSSEILEID